MVVWRGWVARVLRLNRNARFYIHVGRAQYKLLDAPVLIQDAPPDVTFLDTPLLLTIESCA